MYAGSMVGAGAVVFAVMGYVIAMQRPDRSVGSQVELNPRLLAAILGEPVDAVERAIEYLCAPDPQSTTADEGGRRLVRLGQFAYRVVNGPKYLAIRNEETRRQQVREAQRRHRAKHRHTALPGEDATVRGFEQTGEMVMPHEFGGASEVQKSPEVSPG